MTRILYGIFGGEGELLEYKRGTGHEAEIAFDTPYDGFLTVGGITVRVKDGRATVDIRLLDEGVSEPCLIQKDRRYKLPTLSKRSHLLEPTEPDGEFIRRISVRERRLEERVARLEDKLEEISRKVYGTLQF